MRGEVVLIGGIDWTAVLLSSCEIDQARHMNSGGLTPHHRKLWEMRYFSNSVTI